MMLSLLLITVLSLNGIDAANTNVRGRQSNNQQQQQQNDGQQQQQQVEVSADTAEYKDFRRPPPADNQGSLIAMQFSPNPYAGQDGMELIVSGQFSLIHVQLSSDANEARGTFCDFTAQQEQNSAAAADPSLMPRYIDLYGESLHCQDHSVTLPLHEVAEACRKRDDDDGSSSSSNLKDTKKKKNTMRSIEPTAFIFHQPKSGSTLLSNMIAVASSTRVISEPQAIHEVVNCKKCSLATKKQALRDVMYLLGRLAKTQDQQKLYMKLTASSTAAGLSLITRETYPDTKWLFLSRDPATILQKLMNHRVERRHCDESKRRNPGPDMEEYLLTHHEKTKKHLTTPEQACAAYLATNTALARQADGNNNNNNMTVDYDTDLMDNVGIARILDFLEIENPNWDRIDQQRNKRGRNQQRWVGEEDATISAEVASAIAEYSVSAMS